MRTAKLWTPIVRSPQWIAALCFLTCFSWSSPAQTVSASIVGTITDQSGAAVSEARVSATNLETGISYTAATDEAVKDPLAGTPARPVRTSCGGDKFSNASRQGINL